MPFPTSKGLASDPTDQPPSSRRETRRPLQKRLSVLWNRHGQKIGVGFLLILGGILLADWGASRAVQASLLLTVDRFDQQLKNDHLIFTHTPPVTDGWPWGARLTLEAPHLQGSIGPYEFGAVAQHLQLGGSWLTWLKSGVQGATLPLQLRETALLRIVSPSRQSLTFRSHQLAFFLHSHNHGQNQRYDFQAETLEAALLGFDENLRFSHLGGTLQLHPAPFPASLHPVPSRISLFLTARKGQLRDSAFLRRFLDGLLANTSLARGEIDVSNLLLGLNLSGNGPLQDFPHDGNWQLIIPEAACAFPLPDRARLRSAANPAAKTATEIQGGKPRLVLSGRVNWPGGKGEITARLQNWRGLVATMLQQSGIQQKMSPPQKRLLFSVMAPPAPGRPEPPLSLTFPLQHGYPTGLTPERLDILRHFTLSDLARHISLAP
ncbi:hypothetical protein E3E11_01440 [Oecophyllibacter saccharovorans]|uniref:hypothetical protein n=1 Tax=Oecophyllibacter saccharovorans TaxID=2558360 RepID=UPI0011451400|nr:hypothetical protein [Oecophyllibacter saccharovorans]QDH14743.1 hypothetical protein E3E11_01440 [Oecophyllibacter saccharovorans]